tara:strand:+ start:286 stop:1029 length:744 start_codon:yes stop_codon:yes gene_type:complete
MINQDKWIDENKWINTQIKINSKKYINESQLDHDRWINTIPRKNGYNSVKKYSILSVLFVVGLALVSVIKNETRNLEKQIDKLEASVKIIKYNLDQAVLDNEVITSPENIARLAKEYLDVDFVVYKRSQIKKLRSESESTTKMDDTKILLNSENKVKRLSDSMKSKIAKEVIKKKTEIKKIKQLYKEPEKIPEKLKTGVAKKIENKKSELKTMYQSPSQIFTPEKIQKWGVIQVVKLFLGMPVVPGR